MNTIKKSKKFHALLGLIAAVVILAACGSDSKSSSAQTKGDAITNSYTESATQKVPYPLEKMKAGGWLERTLLAENLLRQNDPHRIAYVTLLNVEGQPIAEYTIQGMVFDLNSQMTPTDLVAQYCNEHCDHMVTAAAGDNGTWGPEPNGIGFFDTNGVEHKWNGLWLESDSPDNITTKPVIVATLNASPSVNGGLVGSKDSGGINVNKATEILGGPTTTTTPKSGG